MPGLTTLRGYGTRHQKQRKIEDTRVRAGEAICARCGLPIQPWQLWDLGHHDLDRSIYVGPEHRLARDCPAGGNRATGRKGRATARRRKPRRLSRVW